jgi:hypothetical protein
MAQTARTEGQAAIQSESGSSPTSHLQAPADREENSTGLNSHQTALLLNSANFRVDLGRYALFGSTGESKAFVPVSASHDSLSNPSGAKVAFRPASEPEKVPTRLWSTLLIAQHGAAVFDAWSTRDVIQQGAHELNPLYRPFAGSNLIYAATQVGPGLFDYLGYRMMKSKRGWERKLWWLPQVAGTVASLFSGAHNLSVSQARPSNPAP